MSSPKIRRLIWDIETSPNICFSWRTGFKISLNPENIIHERAIICICYKWEDHEKVHSLEWDNGDDRQLVEDFAVVAAEADEMIAHNGDKFDIRWFNGRNLMHGLPPLPEYKTVDTYRIAKSKFNLNSFKLDYLAKILLGEGKIKTEFDMWKDICIDNDAAQMKKMVRYCKRDVLLLQRVWEKLAQYHKPKTHAGVLTGEERWTCPHCGSGEVIKSKTRITPMGMKQHQMHCKDCARYYTVSNFVFKQYLTARYGEYVGEAA